jgi:hypothetical protein
MNRSGLLLTRQHLRQIAVSEGSGGWETLFQDPNDGRYWERTFPQSERSSARLQPAHSKVNLSTTTLRSCPFQIFGPQVRVSDYAASRSFSVGRA